MNPDMYRDALLEIAFSISGEFDLEKLLRNCLPIFTRKLNCTLAAVLKREKNACATVHLLPKAMAKHPAYHQAAARLHQALDEREAFFWRSFQENGVFYYAFPLDAWGFLMLGRSRTFDAYFLHEMKSLTAMLARACLSCIEVEKRRQSEAQLMIQKAHFESIFTNTQDAMAYFDVQHRIFHINERFTRMFGYTAEEVRGRVINRVVDPMGRQKDYGSPRILAGETIEIETLRYTRDGRAIEVLLKGGPVHVDGLIQGGYAIYSDISPRKKNERQLLETNLLLEKAIDRAKRLTMQAETANIAKSAFLATMSHEIRTPLNTILGLTELCLRTPLSEKQQHYLFNVVQAGRTLLGIINDVLDFSRIEAGKLRLENTAFHLDDVLTQLWNLVSAKAREKGIELLCSRDAAIPDRLMGDPLRLGQILTNLVGNAIKFTESGGEVLLSVRLLKKEDKALHLTFQIRDTGIGMHAEQLQQLFLPFSQADSSTTRKFGGSGLGLSISRQLVELMQGEIHMESAPGKGSTCTFTCRLEVETGPPPPSPLPPVDLRDLPVLVVDDNPAAREIFRNTLAAFSFRPETAASAVEALERIRRASPPFAVVLMDLRMPGCDGLEAARRIMTDPGIHRPPKIILVSAFVREDILREKDAEHLSGFMEKPGTPSLLLDTILGSLGASGIRKGRGKDLFSIPEESLRPLRGKRLLLVEDHVVNRQVAMEILGLAGIAVDTAANGLEALEKVRLFPESPYDAILMDVQMPLMDGYEATRKIRELPAFSSLPILAMTANALVEDRQKALACGMDGYLTKPIDTRQLFTRLLQHLAPEAPPPPQEREPLVRSMPPFPEIPGVDTEAGLGRLAFNPAAYVKLLLRFCEKFADTGEKIRQALRVQDRITAVRLAHTLKGVAATIGAEALTAMAGELEIMMENTEDPRQGYAIAALDRELSARIDAIRQALRIRPDPAPPGPRLSPSELANRVHILYELIAQYDTRAEEILETLLASPLNNTVHQTFIFMKKRIRAYDFDGALALLHPLMQRMEPCSPPSSPGDSQ